MRENIETTIKRHESTAEFWKTKADREWAYAKNGMGGEHYHNAKMAYEKAAEFERKANTLKGKSAMDTVSKSFVPITQATMGIAGATAVFEAGKAAFEGEDLQTCIEKGVGKGLETAVSTGSSMMLAQGAGYIATMINPALGIPVILTTAVVSNGCISEAIEGSFDNLGDKVDDALIGLETAGINAQVAIECMIDDIADIGSDIVSGVSDSICFSKYL